MKDINPEDHDFHLRNDVEYNGKKYYVSTSYLFEYYETMVFVYLRDGKELDWGGEYQLRCGSKSEAVAQHAKVISNFGIIAGAFYKASENSQDESMWV